jgi:hypothetical protein
MRNFNVEYVTYYRELQTELVVHFVISYYIKECKEELASHLCAFVFLI